MSASGGRSSLEWHLDQHDSSFVGMLCLDHIAMPPHPRPNLLGGHTHLDYDDHPDTSTDEEMEVSSTTPALPHDQVREYASGLVAV